MGHMGYMGYMGCADGIYGVCGVYGTYGTYGIYGLKLWDVPAGDAANQRHELFRHYSDPCRLGLRREAPWAMGADGDPNPA